MSNILNEINRKGLVRLGRIEDKDRFKKRVYYHPKDFRGVNIKRFFENDEVVFTTEVDNGHEVIIKFEGALSALKDRLSQTGKLCTLRDMIVALSRAIDDDYDIKVRCSCPDFTYRFAYWATIGEYIYGSGQMEIPKYDRTNKDGKGSTCKHLLALLSNKQWLIKLASVLNNYVRLNKEQTYDYLYESPPEDDVDPRQVSMFDDEPSDNKEDATDDTADTDSNEDDESDGADEGGEDNDESDR